MKEILKTTIIATSLFSSSNASQWIKLSQVEVAKILETVENIKKQSPSEKVKTIVLSIKNEFDSYLPNNICCKLKWKTVQINYIYKY